MSAYGFVLRGAGISAEGRGRALPLGDPGSTNNVAEYLAAIRALERLVSLGFRGPVVLRGDSQLVIRQMRGEYAVRAERLHPYHLRLQELCRGFRSVRFEWVPREENLRADELSKQALFDLG